MLYTVEKQLGISFFFHPTLQLSFRTLEMSRYIYILEAETSFEDPA